VASSCQRDASADGTAHRSPKNDDDVGQCRLYLGSHNSSMHQSCVIKECGGARQNSLGVINRSRRLFMSTACVLFIASSGQVRRPCRAAPPNLNHPSLFAASCSNNVCMRAHVADQDFIGHFEFSNYEGQRTDLGRTRISRWQTTGTIRPDA
jgi:hypothetical protein